METKKPRLNRKALAAIVAGVALLAGFAAGIAGSAAERESLQNRLDAANTELEEYAAKHDALVAAGERATRALRQRDRALDRRENRLVAAETEVKRTTITDGIWKVGTDFDTGTYRAPGGPGCYWALLNSADTSDIANNGGFGPNQTITIDSAWFETSGCGEWTAL